METTIAASEQDRSKRLDILVAEKTGITRSQVQKLMQEGHLLVNRKAEPPGYRVRAGDVITLHTPAVKAGTLTADNIPLAILYSDEHLVVVDKPAGLVVYPSAGHEQGTLMNAILHHCGKTASIGGPLRPGVVHRLDKDTSGVMVVALSDEAYYGLIEQFRKRGISRKYRALVYGDIKGDSGVIDLDIGRSTSDRKKMSTRTRRGKEALTRWRVLKRYGAATLIEATLGTGRTHQIRVHFAAIGHPVLGDRVYGRKSSLDAGKRKILFPRQMLHAENLGFTHPVTGERMEFSSPPPPDLEDCMRQLGER
jgi:23S rRNA pseudouridine1911/1915/1917 synthase